MSVDPIFAVADMHRAAEHYERLGFEISYHDKGYAFAQRQGLNLHLDLTDSPAPGGGCSTDTSMTPTNSLRNGATAGAEVTEPQDYPWGSTKDRTLIPTATRSGSVRLLALGSQQQPSPDCFGGHI